ncbi:MAG: urease accessory protein UreF [Pseudomonadota bacterium]
MNAALIRLLHLASPTLPVGAYTYSQGLEWAVESGALRNEAAALAWIGDGLAHGLARFEAVYLAHMLRAWHDDDLARLTELDSEFIASRETAELRAETLQMGHSLARLLADLPEFAEARLTGFAEPSFPLVWSRAAAHWAILAEDAVAAYLWAWAENQVMAALKAVPLGQTAGQRLLLALGERLPELARHAAAAPIENTHNLLPALAIASSRHETQYTRIFRS